MRLFAILGLLLLAACGTPRVPVQNSPAFAAYAADLRATAIACIRQAGGVPEREELPVPTRIGSYTWNPTGAPFFVNGQRNQAAIATAENCFWQGTKHHVLGQDFPLEA